MIEIEVQKKITNSFNNNFPFVIYRKPNKQVINGFFQHDESVNYTVDFSESGFVFAPFDNTQKSFIIPFANAEQHLFLLEKKNIDSQPKKSDLKLKIDNEYHINLVQKGIDFINDSNAQKIVLSRKEVFKINNFNVFDVLEKLLHNYPNAFVYAWFHPLTGLWMGATPETLIQIKDQKFKTMALASTQSYKGTLDVIWEDKEKQEHQFVTDFIKSKLNDLYLKIGEPSTIKAGNLLHICSEVEGKLTSDNQLNNLIKILHPTPAVCGIPKETAKQFILKNEDYDREFYTGFLGEINQNLSSNLYVNLRCMKVEPKQKIISIFVGGGITKDSNPQKEWEETIIKSEVMKRVL